MDTSSIATSRYDERFFAAQRSESLASALAIVPVVVELLAPKSVLDVGCGIGSWLRAFADHGVSDYLGIDGSYVDRTQLLIPHDRFRAEDLSHPKPLERTFDLAVCLEVGEHLPHAVAPSLVHVLTQAAPAVLFSAALPRQGGTNHVNERWPSYWRQLFAAKGYVRLDPIRPLVWRDERVAWWYRQNIYMYVREEVVTATPKLAKEYATAREVPFELIHERVFYEATRALTLSDLLSEFPKAIRRSLDARRRRR